MQRSLLLAAALAALACGPGDGAAPRRIVLVTIDTLRADRVGSYGAAGAATPVLDALAAGGVRFEQAIAPTPLTLPSHATLFTGQDPPRHGVHHNALFRLGAELPTLAERLREAGFATAGVVSAFVLDRRFGLDRGFDVYDDRMALADRRGIGFAERPGDASTDAAIAWLATAPERFFLWLHLYDPHAPYTPPQPQASRFAADLYAGEIAFADTQVGRLLEAVERRFPDGATLVAVTSDHGESLGEHGEATHSYGIYDATQRVPLLLRGPGLPQGRVVAELVRLADLAPTLLELAGAAPLGESDGESLLAVLRGGAAPRAAYVQTLATRFDMGWSPLYGLRTRDRKWIRAPMPELYDLAGDPGELTNHAPQDAAAASQLDRMLEERLAGARDALPNLDLDPAERARLEALGYVAARADGEDTHAPVRLGAVTGPNPRDSMGLITAMHEANARVAVKRFAEALEGLAPLPDLDWVLTLRAIAALGAGRLDVAYTASRRMIATRPEAADGHVLLGRAFEAEGRLEEARAAFEAGVAVSSAYGASHTGLARLAEARGERAAASESYRRALEARLPDLEAAWRLAALRLEDGDVAEAGHLLADVPAKTLAEEAVAGRLGVAELRAGRYELGLLRVQGGLRQTRRSRALLQLEGSLLEQLGRLDEALVAREDALAIEPKNPLLENDVAWTLALVGRRPARALALAESAASALPREPAVRGTLAAAMLLAGQPLAALAQTDEALPLASGDTRVQLLLHRAEALARLGRAADARAALAEALAGRPPDPTGATLALLERRVRLALGES